ncbi:MAG: WYL domain-containing protein, partial [bacterium]|nr:WYL domain-containing protein [bacterium]MDW8163566.1 WYL domain-containing protein [Candidatus Omnitrophota bacterium]
KEIEIIYISNNVKSDNKKEITKRKILPLGIIIENDVKYLKAYCYLRKEERKFRFDKIIEILDN